MMDHFRVCLLFVLFVSVSACESQHRDDILIRQVVNGSESEPKVMSWEDHFSLFKRRYGKVYNSHEEHQHRFEIFRSNFMRATTRHQRMDPFARHGVTQFSDLTHSEFRRKHLGVKGAYTFSQDADQAPVLDTKNLPGDFDWRDRGAVTPVKNQVLVFEDDDESGQMDHVDHPGVSALQVRLKVLTSSPRVNSSAQQLVDCDHQPRPSLRGCTGLQAHKSPSSPGHSALCDPQVEGSCDSGCNGGLMNIASAYTFDTGGLMREEDCPYTGATDVAINSAYMQSYVGGVLCPYMCSRSLNHGVLLVGYGSEGSRFKEKPYWIIKNSWGETWGENGFYKLCKGRNICGFGSFVSTVATSL
ncbi:hypothetical protein DY000_02057279 [Brassica cretica]|uniref:Uncharacterized protein n=1 Tax=Brassica cretica TaxID=69181 RepID=A0ABQ7AD09_BRACR|nr:hypothetical protein DY000_02057279 [Brassica cretica]